jgi:pimeloyl-ACP methyl ester carboxylesterase
MVLPHSQPVGTVVDVRLVRASQVVAMLLLAAGAIQGSAARAPATSFDGVLSLPGGRSIAMRCAGRGGFTILLEPGDGGRRTHMNALFAVLSKRYRVCDYDRRNIGRSSGAPLPRKTADLMSDAFDALAAAGEKGPFIGFGTSMGGLLVRSYAASGRLEGFVTSNQPCTANEWRRFAYPAMTQTQRVQDDAWMVGENNEHIDVEDVGRTVDEAGALSTPHILMISTERYQCKAAGICGRVYQAFVKASATAAHATPAGRLQILDGDHDLYTTNRPAVIKAIDEVAKAVALRERR